MRLIVTTQYRENYGAMDWDGKGQCPQYWKNKGGVDYAITLPDNLAVSALPALVEKVAAKVNRSNDYVEEYVIGWNVLATGELTGFEQDQLDYEGRIQFPAHELEV